MSQKQYAYFSAAIRDGAKLRPQAFGWLLVNNGTCAMGAGYEAVLGTPTPETSCRVFEMFPYLASEALPCPVLGCDGKKASGYSCRDVGSVLTHLNDDHRWTREQIADWLYAEEEKLGFITVLETEALKPEMIAEFEPLKATV